MPAKVFEDWSGGENTDKDPAELADNESQKATDIDPRYKRLKKLPGIKSKSYGQTPPTGINWEGGLEIQLTKPAVQTVTFLHGRDSSTNRHRIFMYPYPKAGAFVTNDGWLELTEVITGTSDTGSTTAKTVDAAELAGYEDNYFKGFYYVNRSENYTGIVESSSETNTEVVFREAVTVNSSLDNYTLARSKVEFDGNIDIKLVEGENESVIVLAGGSLEYAAGALAGTYKSDAKIQYIDREYFDNDFDFQGMLMARNNLEGMDGDAGITSPGTSTITGAGDGFPNDAKYLLCVVPVYDGFQEPPPYTGTGDEPYTEYANGHLIDAVIPASGDYNVSLTISLDTHDGGIDFANQREMSHRITAMAVYMAEAIELDDNSGSGVPTTYGLASEWKRVKTVSLNDGNWTVVGGGVYTNAIEITYPEFTSGIDLSLAQGHTSENIKMNCSFMVNAAKQRFYAYTYPDVERPDVLLATPITSDTVNTPDVKPWSNFIDLSEYGIDKIIGMFESINNVVIIGENRIIRYDPINQRVARILALRGGIAEKGIVEVNGIVYIAGKEDIYAFSTIGSFEREGEALIGLCDRGGKGGIKGTYQNVGTKSASVFGYDEKFNCIICAVGFQKYLFFIDQGCWIQYDGGSGFDVYDGFIQDTDGRVIALDSNNIYDLLADVPDTNNEILWISKELIGPGRTKRIRIHSNKIEEVTYKLIDAESGQDKVEGTYRTFDRNRTGKEASADLDKLEIRIDGASSTLTSHRIDRVEVVYDETGVR